MKNRIKILAIIIGVVFFASCEEEREPVLDIKASPILNAPANGTDLVFNEDNAATDTIKFEWNAADYGFQAAATYVLQFVWQGADFADAIDIATVNQPEIEITAEAMNTKLLAYGLPHSTATNVDARIMATVNENVDTLFSDVMSFSVTPYEVVIIYPSLFVPGDFQAASGYTNDWSPADAAEIYSVLSNDKYEGYVNLNGTQFKFTDEPNWDTNWGDTGADGTLDLEGDNIAIPEAGYYKLNVNLNDLSYTMTKTDWGIIGDATPGGWDADTDMTYDTENNVWTITTDLSAGEMKFRANDAWDLNYGDDNTNLSLEPGGANIPVDEAGSYTITLNLEVPVYTYTIVKN